MIGCVGHGTMAARRAPHAEDNITHLGWHYYMTPEDAARGILLMDAVGHVSASADHTHYPDVSRLPVFRDQISN